MRSVIELAGFYDISSAIINPFTHCGLPVQRERRYTVMVLKDRVRRMVQNL